ncbi:hypothetical protein [Rufibacter latericius]|uniref:Lipocalin-like domain-containing protein n=1 Tax=Rufibacter latericius TaxID=2487040 RepID=A0A3M9MWF1_9BACT|nr:hypothetical protein [Rufibacter latericius]RNI29098.1 hypothetical protein EFB08_06610 [Rufibacter latericius]
MKRLLPFLLLVSAFFCACDNKDEGSDLTVDEAHRLLQGKWIDSRGWVETYGTDGKVHSKSETRSGTVILEFEGDTLRESPNKGPGTTGPYSLMDRDSNISIIFYRQEHEISNLKIDKMRLIFRYPQSDQQVITITDYQRID